MNAKRIVTLLASATEIVYGLGLGQRVVGVSHECDFPPEVVGKPRLTRTAVDPTAPSAAIDEQVRTLAAAGTALYEIDAPRLAELAPDLIVTQAQCDVCAVRYQDVLDAIAANPALAGARVIALNPQTLDDVFADIQRVGQAAGAPRAAERWVAKLRGRVERVACRTAAWAGHQRPRVLAVEWVEPLMAAANWMPELIELAGGRQDFAVKGQHSRATSWDAVRAFNPELVLVMPCGFDLPRSIDEAAALTALPGWDALAAVRSGRVYALDGNAYFNRSGPRLIESLEVLAHLVDPEQSPRPATVDWPRTCRQL